MASITKRYPSWAAGVIAASRAGTDKNVYAIGIAALRSQ